MKKYLYISFALAAFLFVAPKAAFACSCLVMDAPLKKQVEKAYTEASAVFSGEVVEITPASNDSYSLNIKFKVASKWKGAADKEIVVTTTKDSAMCGYAFVVGKTYLVYAYKNDSGLSTTNCSRTAGFSKDGDVRYFKKLKAKKKRT